jgi:hypothetical protein
MITAMFLRTTSLMLTEVERFCRRRKGLSLVMPAPSRLERKKTAVDISPLFFTT